MPVNVLFDAEDGFFELNKVKNALLFVVLAAQTVVERVLKAAETLGHGGAHAALRGEVEARLGVRVELVGANQVVELVDDLLLSGGEVLVDDHVGGAIVRLDHESCD